MTITTHRILAGFLWPPANVRFLPFVTSVQTTYKLVNTEPLTIVLSFNKLIIAAPTQYFQKEKTGLSIQSIIVLRNRTLINDVIQ